MIPAFLMPKASCYFCLTPSFFPGLYLRREVHHAAFPIQGLLRVTEFFRNKIIQNKKQNKWLSKYTNYRSFRSIVRVS